MWRQAITRTTAVVRISSKSAARVLEKTALKHRTTVNVEFIVVVMRLPRRCGTTAANLTRTCRVLYRAITVKHSTVQIFSLRTFRAQKSGYNLGYMPLQISLCAECACCKLHPCNLKKQIARAVYAGIGEPSIGIVSVCSEHYPLLCFWSPQLQEALERSNRRQGHGWR